MHRALGIEQLSLLDRVHQLPHCLNALPVCIRYLDAVLTLNGVGFGSATAPRLARERAKGVGADIVDRSADRLASKINRCSVDRG